jgi:hypothetical protein
VKNKAVLLSMGLALAAAAAGDALGNSVLAPMQMAFPLVVPAPGMYMALGMPGPGGMFTINGIHLVRDIIGPCTEFNVTGNLPGSFPPPWNGAAVNTFTYRTELDPNFVPSPAAPATNVDPMAQFVACNAVRQALLGTRPLINAAAPGAIMIFVDPATAVAGGGPFPANEFYQFRIIE